RLQLERGQALVQQQAPQVGALWLARALETAPDEADLQQVVRTNLDGLRGELPVLRAILADKEMGTALDVSPDGRLVATAGGPAPPAGAAAGGPAGLGRPAAGRPAGELPPAGRVRAVAFGPDGKLVLTGSDDKTARLWTAETARPAGEPLPHPAAVL